MTIKHHLGAALAAAHLLLPTALQAATQYEFRLPVQQLKVSSQVPDGESALQLIPYTIQFGAEDVGSSASPRRVVVSNTGAEPLAFLAAPSVSGDGFTAMTDCGASLPAGDTCEVIVGFAPTRAGEAVGSLTLSTSSANTQTVLLQGTGVWVSAAIALPFEGPDGSTTLTDVSVGQNTVTAHGAARLSTAIAAGGGASLFLDGMSNTQVNLPASVIPTGTQDFTMEGWIRLVAPPASDGAPILSQWGWYQNNDSSMAIRVHQNRTLGFLATNGNGSNANVAPYVLLIQSSSAIPLNTWTHWAVVRRAGTFTLFLSGAPAATGSHAAGASFAINSSTRPAVLGYHPAVNGGSPSRLNAYLDNFRIVKGVAIYTSSFSPSTSLADTAPPN